MEDLDPQISQVIKEERPEMEGVVSAEHTPLFDHVHLGTQQGGLNGCPESNRSGANDQDMCTLAGSPALVFREVGSLVQEAPERVCLKVRHLRLQGGVSIGLVSLVRLHSGLFAERVERGQDLEEVRCIAPPFEELVASIAAIGRGFSLLDICRRHTSLQDVQ